MAFVTCKYAQGTEEESNIYDGQEVVVIYRTDDLGIVIEEGIVEDGVVQLEGTGPLTNERYYIGLKYDSVMKTFPLRSNGKMNAKARLSGVSLFLADNQGSGEVSVGSESRDPVTQEITYPDGFEKGKYTVNIGTSYEEEPYIQIIARGLPHFSLLALDTVYRKYEE